MAMRFSLALAFVAGCAARPWIQVDRPTPGAFIREPETEVAGRYVTEDGRAWIWINDVEASAGGGHFRARVPLREGRSDLVVHLTDGRGRAVARRLPLVVETPDRPRPRRLCLEDGVCLRYEERGRPRRDRAGRTVNAVLVLTPLGFDERLDRLWPDLVGPDRPLDTRRLLVIGVAPARAADGTLAPADRTVAALERLLDVEEIARPVRLLGAASLGAELALGWLAAFPDSLGALLLTGGHEAPFAEESIQALAVLLDRDPPPAAPAARLAWWRRVADLLVAWSYTADYLADPASAAEHALERVAGEGGGFRAALVEKMARHFASALDPRDLLARVAGARALERAPLRFAPRPGIRIRFVANRHDRMIALPRIEATSRRLAEAGADATVVSFEDSRGHGAFFHAVPSALLEAARELVR